MNRFIYSENPYPLWGGGLFFNRNGIVVLVPLCDRFFSLCITFWGLIHVDKMSDGTLIFLSLLSFKVLFRDGTRDFWKRAAGALNLGALFNSLCTDFHCCIFTTFISLPRLKWRRWKILGDVLGVGQFSSTLSEMGLSATGQCSNFFYCWGRPHSLFFLRSEVRDFSAR